MAASLLCPAWHRLHGATPSATAARVPAWPCGSDVSARACREECDRQLEFDLGHLLACHPSAPSDPAVAQGDEDALRSLATKVTQSLIRQVFTLPSHATPDGRMVALPTPQFALPRFKPVPKPKPLTKWQKFAKEKGIVKKKQSKLLYDETAQDWKRRHGYKRGNDEAAVPVIEASDKDQVGFGAQ